MNIDAIIKAAAREIVEGTGSYFVDATPAYKRWVKKMCLKAESILRRHFAGLEVVQWRPIETAPKDGTWIVAIGTLTSFPWSMGVGTIRATVTRWNETARSPVYARGWQFVSPGYMSTFEPTLWQPLPVGVNLDDYAMPLPPPPKEAEHV